MPAATRFTRLGAVTLAGAAIAAALAGGSFALAQTGAPSLPSGTAEQERAGAPIHSLGENPAQQQTVVPYSGDTRALLQTPVSDQFPGGIATRPQPQNPVGNDPAAVQRGMSYFTAFNCLGCHTNNGGGGMGRALSNRYFQYGSAPANIYLSIVQGRPNGMPAWGGIRNQMRCAS